MCPPLSRTPLPPNGPSSPYAPAPPHGLSLPPVTSLARTPPFPLSYFSVMTITSVGYGDISATPFNATEQYIAVALMLCSGMIWGYLIGIFCTLASVSATTAEFRAEISDLNTFMRSMGLATELRFRLREYLHQTIHLRQMEAQRSLMSKLSPTMQGEVSLLVHQRTIGRIWYLAEAELGLLIHISSQLAPLIFAPYEFCPSGILYVLQRGTALYAATKQQQGATWGDDVLLNHEELQCDFPAVAISYLFVLTLSGPQLAAALSFFPASKARLERIRRRWVLRRSVVRAAELQCYASGRSFRGRLYPLYAKAVAVKLRNERRAAEAQGGAKTMLQRRSDGHQRLTVGSASFVKRQPKTAERLAALTMKDAAAEYGMAMRQSQRDASDGGAHTVSAAACASRPRARARGVRGRAGSGGRTAGQAGADTAPPALDAEAEAVGGAPAAGGDPLAIEARLAATVDERLRAMLPELAAAVATSLASAQAQAKERARALRKGEHTKERPPRHALAMEHPTVGSVQRAPSRTMDAISLAAQVPPAAAPPIAASAPSALATGASLNEQAHLEA